MKNIIFLVAIDSECSTQNMARMVQANYGADNCAILNLPDAQKVEGAFMSGDLNALFDQLWNAIEKSVESTILLAGLPITHPYALQFNLMLAIALNCQVLLLASQDSIKNHASLIQGRLQQYAKHNRVGLLVQGNTERDRLPENLAKYFVDGYEDGCLLFKGLNEWLKQAPVYRFTPTMLRHYILSSAKKQLKRIILPEGEDLRVIKAANLCQQQGIAQCVILGNQKQIAETCTKHNIALAVGIEFIDPEKVRAGYAGDYYELRKNKGATMESAQAAVQNNATLAALMLKRGEVDGMVSGACHPTSDTLLPAFQLIKPKAGQRLISSLFFVCMPSQVLAFADCAVNPNPTPEELATIAEQSAETAKNFGILPKVAMLSYSTLGSGKGTDVELVTQAINILKERAPELLADGPMQYDAAIVPEVGKLKAPGSKIAGQATVLVFPSLEAGNIGYKIAQRSAGVVCIGPVLQGLAKPVNDLSRGCLVEDIVFTVAVTALQAGS